MVAEDDKKIMLMKLAFLIAGAIAVFAYAQFVIEPELIYHAQGRMITYEHFEIGWEFFIESFSTISGPVNYLSAFLTNLFYYPLTGATIISGLFTLLCIVSYKLIEPSPLLRKIPAAALVPSILMLIAYNRYRNHTSVFISIIIASTSFLLYRKIRKQNFAIDSIAFVLIFLIIFWLTGYGCLIFGGLCALSCSNKTQIGMAIFFTALTAAFYWACSSLLVDNFPFFKKAVMARDGADLFAKYSCYLCIFTIAAAVLLSSLKKNVRRVKHKPKKPVPVLLVIINLLILCVVPYASLVPSFHKQKKHLLKVGDYSVRGQYDEVIAYCQKRPFLAKHYLQLSDVGYALFKKGRLLEDLFEFPQNYKAILLNVNDESPRTLYRRIKLMYELGYAGFAQKYAHEMQVINSNEPEAQYALALIYLAKENPVTAVHFLNKLKKNIVYKNRAEQLLNLIDDGGYVNPLASSVVQVDQINYTFNTELFFGSLLDKNPKNKMAFDYMMAFFLLTKHKDRVVKYAHLLQEFGYEKLPVAVRQAIITHKLVKGDAFDISGYDISDAELKDGEKFFLATKNPSFKYNAEIISQYKTTYYYYHAFTKFD